MATYKVTVTTGEVLEAGSSNSISITLVGSQGESSKKPLRTLLYPGKAAEFTVRCERDLGPLVLVRLHKWRLFLEDAWFCQDVQVTAPGGRSYRFPCYQWLEDVTTLELREGAGKKPADDVLDILKEHRRRELAARQDAYRWKIFAEGWPRCLDVGSIHELQSDAKFSCERGSNFVGFLLFQGATHLLSGFLLRHTSWKSLDEMRSIFSKTKGRDIVPEYVARHWREDTFFGYQYLNGNNPIVIRKCTELPEKFPVTPAMVADSLGAGTTLAEELQAGRIFIVDYEILEGLPAGTIHGRQQYVAAPLCLLHQDAGGHLRPIAIQLSQRPGPTSPIFLPSDSEWDWLLAKTWVRNADFYVHQILSHLLRTHLFGEVFTIATLRHLASCHPVFKLLIPHFRFTLHINTLARTVLINRGGVIDKGSGLTHEGIVLLLQRGLEKVTYTSLCLPDDIRARGVTSVPNYFYRDDGLKMWEATESFVTGIVAFYYGDDAAVRGDTELQAWVMDIFTNGFLGRASSGVPSSLRTVAELTKFLTMVIFTCSSQHAAVNNGQYDLGAFMPNAPSSMRHPPPEEKGRAFEQHFLDTVPEVDTTANILVALILLSSRLDDARRLGQYPEERFTEPEPRRLIRDFRRRLEELGDDVEERHRAAELRYRYLDPRETENSISI
ncbi:hydroperoxide isomerase ALOXE3-like [Apteryx rowi]|uniref:hydroperoxide isomerase ALOXE3-like n=1 Tax=Apteryx rowi TaxID=308060 RepID=UPI000E1D24AB|nr:hydroperoxide isomerase ALOXE3-like [Apteryx rowi]